MAKVPFNSLQILRRAYTVAAENVKVQSTASVMRKVSDSSNIQGVEKEDFWMRDPKTGNWVPENHFDEVDAADLREKFCSKKNKF